MQIRAITNGVERAAYKLSGKVYKCFPPSSNRASTAREFDCIEDAAAFLCRNRGWGIRMNPGSAIIYDNIVIHLDD
jgi:hypothetical protein